MQQEASEKSKNQHSTKSSKRQTLVKPKNNSLYILPLGVLLLSFVAIAWLTTYLGYSVFSKMVMGQEKFTTGLSNYVEVFFGGIVPVAMYGLIQMEFWWNRLVLLGLIVATGIYLCLRVFVVASGVAPIVLTLMALVYFAYLSWYLFMHPYCIAYYRFLKNPNTVVPDYSYPAWKVFQSNNKVIAIIDNNLDMIVILFLVLFVFFTFAQISTS